MYLQTKVGLLSECTVPISGFPLDELVLEIKNVFDTYLINSVQSNPQQFYSTHGVKPCCKEFKKRYRCKSTQQDY